MFIETLFAICAKRRDFFSNKAGVDKLQKMYSFVMQYKQCYTSSIINLQAASYKSQRKCNIC